jgi:arylsulfatase A-like enzyme
MAWNQPNNTVPYPIKQVILVSVDTLRADALSAYNPNGFATPGTDRLARDGVVFERPISAAPWTVAALASIMTGVSPTVHTVTEIKSRLPDNVVTLAERMRDAGYHTGAMVLNDLLRPESNLPQGFEEYAFLTEPSYGDSFGARLLQAALPSAFPSTWPTTAEITEQALQWFERNRDNSFFYWLHYYDPHAPYTPPVEYMQGLKAPQGMTMEFWEQRSVLGGRVVPSQTGRVWVRALYDGEVRYVDDYIGKLIDGLKRLGIYDDALIVFTSDHGEEFWEHGAHGHGNSQYNELLWVPLIFKLPGMISTGRVSQTVGTQSIMPTVLDLIGIGFDRDRLSSPTLLPLLIAGRGEYEEQPVVSTAQVLFDKKDAVTRHDVKYIRSELSGEEEIFDLNRDPGERQPLGAPPAAVLEQVRNTLAEHRQASNSLRAHFQITDTETAGLDEDTRNRLKALGYLP